MKALFFADVPHRLAGAQKSLLLSLSRLAEHGVEPVVAFPHAGIFEAACRRAGLEVRVLPSPAAFQSFGRALMRLGPLEQAAVLARQLLPFSRRLAELARREGASAFHFNTPRGITMAGAAARLARLPAMLHLRGVPAIPRGYWLPAQALADRLILVAGALAEHVAPSVRPRSRVVYNGVVTSAPIPRDQARARLVERLSERGVTLPESASLLVCVSSPTPFKGLHHLLAAAELLAARGHDLFVVCAGAGSGEPYEAWLDRRVAASAVGSRFALVGFWDDVHELLSAADVTVLPSVQEETLIMDGSPLKVRGTEGLPRAILESFAAGVPVVASDVAGVREQVEDGVSGLVVPPGDAKALAAACDRALSDRAWRLRAGRRGSETVLDRFTVDAAARGLARELIDLAAHPPSDLSRVQRLLALSRDFAMGRA